MLLYLRTSNGLGEHIAVVLECFDVIKLDDTGCDLLDKEVDSHYEMLDNLRAAGKLRGEGDQAHVVNPDLGWSDLRIV